MTVFIEQSFKLKYLDFVFFEKGFKFHFELNKN